jgi:hypothetical protein
MQRTLSIVLTLAMLTVVFSDLVIVASWKLNEAYIARFLCVEREIEASDCGGTCYLTAQLQAAATQEPGQLPLSNLLEQSRTLMLALNAVYDLDTARPVSSAFPQPGNETLTPQRFTSDIFHPPRV